MSEKILFLTGKLAERQLKRILSSMKPEFRYKINQIGVNVAALMSENIIMRRLDKNQDADRIIIPGKFRGDIKKLSRYFNIPVERGPDDISHLPDYFGIKTPEDELEKYDCEIFAEIVDAADISIRKILAIAKKYKEEGANVIDLGCMPDTKFHHLEDTVKALKFKGFRVSIDSANSSELIRGSKAGADYVLSINERNIEILDKIHCTPVLIPSQPGDLNSLKRIIRSMKKRKRDFFADPILDPIHYGFADSIQRYICLRNDFPDIKIFMGTGNLTELTDSDSAGVNATLMGLVSELSINAVLVVQVSGHCKNSIKETDVARKIMFFSKQNKRLPFRIDNRLMPMSERKPTRKTKREINEIKKLIKDKNFRIYLGEEGVNIFNSEVHMINSDPYEFYDKLNINNDASHAFYLGIELARAQIAWELGKNYDQDNKLKWGVASKEGNKNLAKHPEPKSTQRKK